MSHYRERRDKIKNLQSKSLDHLGKIFLTWEEKGWIHGKIVTKLLLLDISLYTKNIAQVMFLSSLIIQIDL